MQKLMCYDDCNNLNIEVKNGTVLTREVTKNGFTYYERLVHISRGVCVSVDDTVYLENTIINEVVHINKKSISKYKYKSTGTVIRTQYEILMKRVSEDAELFKACLDAGLPDDFIKDMTEYA